MAGQSLRVAGTASSDIGWERAQKAYVRRTTHVARALAVLTVAAITLVAVLAIVSPVLAAEGPRWDIVSTSNPTNIAPGSPANEVQEVTVNATGGTFRLSVSDTDITPCANSETAAIPYNAPASEVQSALGAACSFLEGRMTVTGGSGGAGPYTITFTGNEPGGEPGDGPVGLLGADSSSLTGGAATVREVTRGQYTPELVVSATNVGGASTDEASPIAIEDTLPAGSELTATSITGFDAYHSGVGQNGEGGAAMSCSAPPTLRCTYSGKVDPGDVLIVAVRLSILPSLPLGSYVNRATVTGGGAPEASVGDPVRIGDTPAGFGPAPGSFNLSTSTSQAGAHANVTTAFTLDTSETDEVAGYAKDLRFDTPPGLVGNTVGMPRCEIARVVEEVSKCPTDTMVGMVVLTLTEGADRRANFTIVAPVYNIAPAPGEPAAFAFNALIFPIRLDTSVLSDGNYGVRVTVAGVPQSAETLSTSLTFWGVPADHNGPGEDESLYNLIGGGSFGGPNPDQTRVPLLTMPQQCFEPLSAEMSTDSWTNPGVFVSSGPVPVGTLTGCDLLSFRSSFTMLPDTLEAGAPAGYSFDLNVPQRNEPDGLATPNVKDVKLTLPAGVVVNPSAAVGLRACSDAQFFGPDRGRQEPATPGACPREAQVGKVRVKTPALEEALEGEVYLAEPECDPCTPQDAQDGRMIRLFMQVVSEGEGGIVVKLEGKGQIDQRTGQITTTFESNPQLPFDKLELALGGGPRAVLANPRVCGPVTSSLDLTPWSTPFTSDSIPFSGFEVNKGCFGAQFGPSFVAGSPNIQAGEYTPFTLAFGRSDHDQFLGGLSLSMPPGLLGNIGAVTLCREPEASEGSCGPGSLIGHVQVLTGPGADPFLVSGGQVFLTGSYRGAPYGLSIVVPAVAGPYTLSGTTGHGTVVVRAKIMVDPTTAALTVTSDPLPSMLDGIPLQLKVVNVTIDKPGFTFNPTNCGKLSIGASLSSTEGMSASVASPFQVTNCANLGFKPQFKVATSGKTSRAHGASLDVKLSYPRVAFGSQANIAKVKVDLPKRLPSRLSTLQKACPDSVFNQNPAACPPASIVGSATATTPIIPVALSGPAYFVSHGGAKFPELVIVLSGYGVTVQLHGETFISTAGVTSSTFRQVPDVPVSSFELKLPRGPFSALAANGNLCKSTLKMPTAFMAQNGAVIHQSTPIAVTGCSRHKAAKKASKLKKR
jgi:hypothetical protein